MTHKENVDSGILRSIDSFLGDVERLGMLDAVDKLCSIGDAKIDLTKLPQTSEVHRGPLCNSLTLIKRLEAMAETFSSLAGIVVKKLDSVKEELQPACLHCGIQTLPNEILVENFEYVVHVDRDVKDALMPEVGLSHVCSRFRSVLLSTLSLWSRISSQLSLPWVDAHLERMKNELLTIKLGTSSSQMTQILKRIIPHAPKWRHLYFNERNSSGTLDESTENLDLPEVEYFECFIDNS